MLTIMTSETVSEIYFHQPELCNLKKRQLITSFIKHWLHFMQRSATYYIQFC